tara:strand:+ start:424 stop:804 length:381 start_codon:yes stop_codon:yes gene_type:complete
MTKTLDRKKPFKRFDKVVAANQLQGVPEGTPGKVKLANGITWNRYWVDFSNGVTIGSIDHDDLAHRKDWPQFKIDREKSLEKAALETEVIQSDETSGETSGESSNPYGVPEHLLERSRAARVRLSG